MTAKTTATATFSAAIIAAGDQHLNFATLIAFADRAPGNKVRSFSMDEHTLKFFGTAEGGDHPLPAPCDNSGAADLARRWLADQERGEAPAANLRPGWGFNAEGAGDLVCTIWPVWLVTKT